MPRRSPPWKALPAGGRLWSAALESWLVPDGRSLRLHDAAGRRLTEAEAARAEAEAQLERQRRECEERLAALEAALRAQRGDPPRG